MKKFILSIIFSCFCVICFAQNQDCDALLKKANDMYVAKQYTLAAELYEQIIQQGYSAPELNYNLANAYFKDGNITKSILNYERAIKLNPDFEDAKFNLKIANDNLRDKINNVPESAFGAIFDHFVKNFGVDSWAIFSLICLAFSIGLFLWYFFTTNKKIRKIAFSFGFVFLVFTFINLGLGFYNNSLNNQESDAIIMENVVSVKSSPDENGTVLFRIHEGIKISIKDNSGDWTEIRLADGRVGWVKKSSIEII